MNNNALGPPVGGETLGVFGPSSLQGVTMMRSLNWRGYQPLHVTGVQEVKNFFDHGVISALIVLESVPVLVVHELCKSLRLINSMTPIVVLLDPSKRDEGVNLLDSGADHYAIQPAQVDEVLYALRALTRRSRQTSLKFLPSRLR